MQILLIAQDDLSSKSGAMKFFNFIGNTFLQHYSVFI